MWHSKKLRKTLAVTVATDEALTETLAFLEEAWEEGAKEAVALAVSCARPTSGRRLPGSFSL
jgi:hypothetical protein